MKTLSDFMRAYSETLATHERQASDKKTPTLPVVISREIGSGGREIAEALALRLGFQLCDHEIINNIAAHSKMPPDIADMMDETSGGRLSLFGASLLRGATPSHEEFDRFLRMTITGLLDLGSVVILGRGSVFMAKPGHALRLRIVAPLESRMQNIMQREKLNEKQARAKIQTTDAERQAFHKRVYGRGAILEDSIDLAINTQFLHLDHAVHLALYAYNRIYREVTGKPSAVTVNS